MGAVKSTPNVLPDDRFTVGGIHGDGDTLPLVCSLPVECVLRALEGFRRGCAVSFGPGVGPA